MAGDGWVVLVEHQMNPWLLPIDGTCIAMLGLEDALLAEDIEVVFDPFRPGEGASFTRDSQQPIRLLVQESQLDQALEIARRLEREAQEADAPGPDLDAGDDSDGRS
jgi:hypothetical protein